MKRNTIHKKVQADIRSKNQILAPDELTIYYRQGSAAYNKSKGGYGYADIYESTIDSLGNDVYYVWEVKSKSYEHARRMEAIEQINGYVNDGYIRSNSNAQILCGETGLTHIAPSSFEFPLQTKVSTDQIEDVTYTVEYHNMQPSAAYPNQAGLIIYEFTRTAQKYKKNRDANENANSDSNSDANSNTNTDNNSETNSDANENQESQEDDGGAGNDYLQGDHGGDTYIFGIGYDTDTVNPSSDDNTIIIHGYGREE